MKKIIAILCLLLIVLSVSFAQEEKQAARERINARRIAFITEQLNLSTAEAQAFWPVYNAYKKEERIIRKKNRKYVKIDQMTDAEIEQYLESKLAAEEATIVLKRDFVTQIKAVLPIQKVAKLFHSERKFKEWMFTQIRKNKH